MNTTVIQKFLNDLIDAGKGWTTRYTSGGRESSKTRSVNVERKVNGNMTEIHVSENTNNAEIPTNGAICYPIEKSYPIAKQFMFTPEVIQFPAGNLTFFDTDYLEGYGRYVKASLAGGGAVAGLIALNYNKLTSLNIDQILMKVNAWDTSGGHIDLTGPEMGAPSDRGGIAAKDALITRGWTVLTNN